METRIKYSPHAQHRRVTKNEGLPKNTYASMEQHWKLQNQTQQWIAVCYTLNQHPTPTEKNNKRFELHSFFFFLFFCWLNIILFFLVFVVEFNQKNINKFSLFGRNLFFFFCCLASSFNWPPSSAPLSLSGGLLNWIQFIFAAVASGMNAINFSIHILFRLRASMQFLYSVSRTCVCVRRRQQIDRNW